MNRSRKQRGGANESLVQGAQFAKFHMNQHGGSRDALMGAPVGYTGVLDSSMRGAARLDQHDAHFAAAQAQSGGSRRRRRQSQSRKNKSRRRQSRRSQSRRWQRGGAMSPADASAPYTLLDQYAGARVPPPPPQGPLVPYTVVGGDRMPVPMKGGRRNRSRRNRRQRGGYSPIGQPSMLLASSEYDKAGLHSDFQDPLLRH